MLLYRIINGLKIRLYIYIKMFKQIDEQIQLIDKQILLLQEQKDILKQQKELEKKKELLEEQKELLEEQKELLDKNENLKEQIIFKLNKNDFSVFINDKLIKSNNDNDKIRIKYLYDVYFEWCQERDIYSLRRKDFIKALREQNIFESNKLYDGYKVYRGYKMKE
jgi:hypothetical protein